MPHQVPQSLVLVAGLCVVVHPCCTELGLRSIVKLGRVFMHPVCGRRELHYKCGKRIMDNLSSGGIGAASVVVLGIIYRVYMAVNHHRVRSNCCGKEVVMSVDVEETTPPTVLKIKAPQERPEGKA